MSGDVFIAELGRVCPELDGGEIFSAANKNWESDRKELTRGPGDTDASGNSIGDLAVVGQTRFWESSMLRYLIVKNRSYRRFYQQFTIERETLTELLVILPGFLHQQAICSP